LSLIISIFFLQDWDRHGAACDEDEDALGEEEIIDLVRKIDEIKSDVEEVAARIEKEKYSLDLLVGKENSEYLCSRSAEFNEARRMNASLLDALNGLSEATGHLLAPLMRQHDAAIQKLSKEAETDDSLPHDHCFDTVKFVASIAPLLTLLSCVSASSTRPLQSFKRDKILDLIVQLLRYLTCVDSTWPAIDDITRMLAHG
jgi:hypothetical protein